MAEWLRAPAASKGPEFVFSMHAGWPTTVPVSVDVHVRCVHRHK